MHRIALLYVKNAHIYFTVFRPNTCLHVTLCRRQLSIRGKRHKTLQADLAHKIPFCSVKPGPAEAIGLSFRGLPKRGKCLQKIFYNLLPGRRELPGLIIVA